MVNGRVHATKGTDVIVDANKQGADESIPISVSLVTRVRTKCFKEQLNSLFHKIQRDNLGLVDKAEHIYVIKADAIQGD